MDKSFAKRAHVEVSGLIYVILRRPESSVLGLCPLFIAGVSGLIVDAPIVFGLWFLLTWVAVLGSIMVDTIFDHSDRRAFFQQNHLYILSAAWISAVIVGIVAASMAGLTSTVFWAVLATLHCLWRLSDVVSLAALDSQGTREDFLNWLSHRHMRVINPAYDPASGDSATIELEATYD